MKKLSLLLLLFLSAVMQLSAKTVTDEGAWCWFADPRALHYQSPDGRICMTYVGYIDIHGNIKAMQYDFNRHRQTEVLVRSWFQPDDHNNPTFLVLPDQRVMIFYSRHTDEPCFYYRVSAVPGDITTLGAEHRIETKNNTTYPSPFIMSDDPEHFYLCWRGINWHPTIARITLPGKDDKVTVDWGPHQIVQSSGARPYAKYASDGKSRIMLAYTTGHPDNESPNLLYYNYVDINALTLHDVTGRKLSNIADGPLKVLKTKEFVEQHRDMVVDASGYRDWVWQITADRSQRPVIAMTHISEDKKSHNYYQARWTGNEWRVKHIAHAGGHFHQSADIEHCYTAGMAIDGDDCNTIYCSVPVNGVYEIVKYRLDGNGEVVSTQAVTKNSDKNNIRPYFIPGSSDSPMKLAWMKGDYYDWIVSKQRPLGYCTGIATDYDFDNTYHSQYKPAETDFSITATVNTSHLGPKGEMLNLGNIVVRLDEATLFPEVVYNNKVYRSTNRLATADSWAQNPRGTNGDWYPAVKLQQFDLRVESREGWLSTYINGMLDQSIHIAAKTKPQTFVVKNPDYKRSPMTGLTRRHWIEAAEYLLEGAFGYINSMDDEMYFPKQLDKTYPRDPGAVKVAKLEGLARTLFIAAPLLRENPDLTLHGIKVADYYRHQLIGLITKGRPNYEPHRTGGPSQTLLELGSVCMSLEIAKEVLWDSFTKDQQDQLAALFKSYGEGPTIGSNWRFFNVFVMSFVKAHGYETNDEYLKMNLTELLKLYRGEGWYNDAPAYDYYSMWAFQTYGPLWAHLFGNKQLPEIAAQFTKNQHDLIDNYPYMFARDGRMNMWGRSIPYRFACVAPFGMIEFGGHQNVNYGWLREISSASLLQFMQNPDFMEDGIPTMGFYGPFAPAVQIYSCRGSVYWMGKAFFNLLLPEDSQYWSATENIGPWRDELKPGKAYSKLQPATNLLITNYPNIGGSEMRSWCKETVAADWQKFRSSENYNKLAYHTEFPWMADGKDGNISMNYGVFNTRGQWEVLRLYDFVSFEDGIYRRNAVLETDAEVKFQLADIPMADGVLRIDKVTVPRKTDIRLGSYSLPRLDGDIKQSKTSNATVIANGKNQLAVLPLEGWDKTFASFPCGLHPVSDQCGLIMTEASVSGSAVFVTLHLWSGKAINAKMLSLVSKVEVSADKKTVTVSLNNGEKKTVTFE